MTGITADQVLTTLFERKQFQNWLDFPFTVHFSRYLSQTIVFLVTAKIFSLPNVKVHIIIFYVVWLFWLICCKKLLVCSSYQFCGLNWAKLTPPVFLKLDVAVPIYHYRFWFSVVVLLVLLIPYKRFSQGGRELWCNLSSFSHSRGWEQRVCCQNNIPIPNCFFQTHSPPAYV